jgi:hypothetical protein
MPLRFLVPLLLLSLSCSASAEKASPLAGHPSPYLAMHADDPVRWRTWHPDVLEEARREGRLVFVSIGYFACHWCHVMQRESYQDTDVATRLNRFTLPVKVDRELHPALDAQLIEFVRSTRGHAGWPLNVFLTPEGYPLLGLVYAPRDDFLALVKGLESAWREDRKEMTRLAREAMLEMSAQSRVAVPVALEGEALLATFEQALWAAADDLEGGFGNQARFPNVPILRVLLERQALHPEPRREAFLRLTLRQMARLGLRDHLGGGFFRYTTDPGWREPHFEKMLYDNAQLLGLYARAAEVLGDTEWLAVAEDTFVFLRRAMRGEDGGYVASLSALDGRGVEGGYYLWSEQELERWMDEDQRRLAGLWLGLQGRTPFAAGHLPLRQAELSTVQRASGLEPDRLRQQLHEIEERLREVRRQRELPRDDKQLAAWNGLVLQGLVALAGASGKEVHGRAARELRDFLVHHLVEGDLVYRMRGQEGFALQGELEDYAQLAAGLLDWAEYADAEADRLRARALVRSAWQQFHGPDGWQLTGEELPGRPASRKTVADEALPSPTATLLALSLRLGLHEEDERMAARIQEALARAAPAVAADPLGHASYLPLLAGEEAVGPQPR